MKKLLYGFLALTIAAASTACLEENPQYTQNSKVIFSSEETAQMALNGIYSYMSNFDGYGQLWWEIPVMTSGMARGTHAQVMGRASDLNMSPADADYYNTAWNGMYRVINEANGFLESMNVADLNSEVKAKMCNEARFLRAISYYNLAAHFGDVPLKLSVPSADDISSHRTPVMEVLAAVVKDLQSAMNLPETSDYGRLNSTAAEAFLGKVYFKMAMLSDQAGDADAKQTYLESAKGCFDNVYGKYSLDADPRNGLFPYESFLGGCKSPEVIIQITYDATSPANIMNRMTYQRFCPYQSTPNPNATGQNTFMKYVYDWQYGTYPGDPRLDVNFATHYTRVEGNWNGAGAPVMATYPKKIMNPGNASTWFLVELPYESFADPTNPTEGELAAFATTKSYTNDPLFGTATSTQITNQTKNLWTAYTTNSNINAMNVNQLNWPHIGKCIDRTAATRSGAPVIVYRYAELLLLMADVYNELGQTGKAISLANEVLSRARNISGNTSNQPVNWPSSLSKNEVTEKLYYERIFELMGEPSMFDMTRMRGTVYLNKVLVRNNRHHITKASAAVAEANPLNFRDILFDNKSETQLSENFLKKVMLWPIPQNEIDANPGITTEDQNFGY